MGYTHYWRRVAVLDSEAFSKLVIDFRYIVEGLTEIGIPLASWDGSGEPEIAEDTIAFNGVEDCGHPKRDLGITWPTEGAMGISNGNGDQDDIKGSWFAGAKLQRRTCGGDCSHESFRLERIYSKRYESDIPDDSGLFFDFCKTAYKPYGVAVCACLLLAKAYLKDQIVISSDGESEDWEDVYQLLAIQLNKEAIKAIWTEGKLVEVQIVEKGANGNDPNNNQAATSG